MSNLVLLYLFSGDLKVISGKRTQPKRYDDPNNNYRQHGFVASGADVSY